jgi:hypothetical protein
MVMVGKNAEGVTQRRIGVNPAVMVNQIAQ